VRLALTVNQVPFEDDRIQFKDWPGLKTSTKFGQLPMMSINDQEPFAQSHAMLRYAGTLGKGSLYPSDPMDRIKVEEALGVLGDFDRSWSPNFHVSRNPQKFGLDIEVNSDEHKALIKKMREKWMKEELPDLMKNMQLLLEKNGGFLAGGALTIADCQALPMLRNFTRGIVDYIPKDVFDAFPAISSYLDRVMSVPEIGEWYRQQEQRKMQV